MADNLLTLIVPGSAPGAPNFDPGYNPFGPEWYDSVTNYPTPGDGGGEAQPDTGGGGGGEEAFVAPAVPPSIAPAPPPPALSPPPRVAEPVIPELLVSAARFAPWLAVFFPGTVGRAEPRIGQPMFEFTPVEEEVVISAPPLRRTPPPSIPPDFLMPPNWNDLLEWGVPYRFHPAPGGFPLDEPGIASPTRGPQRRYRPAPAPGRRGSPAPDRTAEPLPELVVPGRRTSPRTPGVVAPDFLSPALPDLFRTPLGSPTPATNPLPFADPFPFGDPFVASPPVFAPPVSVPRAIPSEPVATPLLPPGVDPFSPFDPGLDPQTQPQPKDAGGCNCVEVKEKPKGTPRPPRSQCKGGVYVQRGKGIKFTPQFIADCATGKKIGELPKGGGRKRAPSFNNKSLGDLARDIFNPR